MARRGPRRIVAQAKAPPVRAGLASWIAGAGLSVAPCVPRQSPYNGTKEGAPESDGESDLKCGHVVFSSIDAITLQHPYIASSAKSRGRHTARRAVPIMAPPRPAIDPISGQDGQPGQHTPLGVCLSVRLETVPDKIANQGLKSVCFQWGQIRDSDKTTNSVLSGHVLGCERKRT